MRDDLEHQLDGLERMGDHAVGVAKADHGVGLAEQTVSVVTGERVEFSSNDPT